MRQRRLMNQINVVPYIDVMLVLLVIFMVTAPLIQVSVVDVPSVGKTSQAPIEPIQIIVRKDRSLAVKTGASDQVRSISNQDLVQIVRDARAQNPEQSFVIAADKSVTYEVVMKVMDQLQRLQVARLGLLVQQKQ